MATITLVILTFCLVFAGAINASPQVNVSVNDENGDPVTVTNPDDKVNVTANATTDEYLNDPAVILTVKPESGLTFDASKAVMNFDGDIYLNDPDDPFFYWSDDYKGWIWWIGWLYGDQLDGELVQLTVPAVVSDVGEITVDADYLQWDEQLDQPVLLATDSFTFLSVEGDQAPVTSAQTVPMQDTGAPVVLAALGLLSIMGGAVFGKLKP